MQLLFSIFITLVIGVPIVSQSFSAWYSGTCISIVCPFAHILLASVDWFIRSCKLKMFILMKTTLKVSIQLCLIQKPWLNSSAPELVTVSVPLLSCYSCQNPRMSLMLKGRDCDYESCSYDII
jgi:hypothetical protein